MESFEQFQKDVKKEIMEEYSGKRSEKFIEGIVNDDFDVMEDGYEEYKEGAYDDCKVRTPYQDAVYYTAHTYSMLN